MLKKLVFLFILLPVWAQAQIPTYYASTDFTKSGDALRQELSNLISSTHHTFLDYTSSVTIDTWDVLKESELAQNDTTNILLLYGSNDLDMSTQNDRLRDKTLSCHTSSCAGLWNREHVFPRSKANPAMNTQFPGTGTDLHNLRAADAQMNGLRINNSYTNGTGAAQSLGGYYYPGDEWRGDVARIIMYMYVRYQFECQANQAAVGSSSYSPLGDMPNILLEWNAQDSVSQLEMNRNQKIFNLQGNRNPFIDNPILATRIWNGPEAQNSWNVALNTTETFLENIQMSPSITTGQVELNDPLHQIESVKIISADGRRIPCPTSNNQFNISNQAAGIYFVRITSKNGKKLNFKLLKK